MIVYRTAEWHPELVSHVFSVCTPYLPHPEKYVPLEDIVKGPLPQFGYQLHLAGPKVEAGLQTEERIRQFLKGMYGGRDDSGRVIFSPENGLDFDVVDKVGMAPLLNQEVRHGFVQGLTRTCSQRQELDYYTREYTRSGMHGPLNWYRTRKANFDDEQK